MPIHPVTQKIPLRICMGLALLCLAGLSAESAESMSPPPKAGKAMEMDSNRFRPAYGRHERKIVKAFFENLGKGDLPAMMAGFAPDAEWVLHAPPGTSIPFAGVHKGRAAVQAFIETFGRNAKPSVFETREFIATSTKVVVLGYEEATALPTGKTWKAHWTMTFTIKGDSIVSVDEVVDTEAISAAFRP